MRRKKEVVAVTGWRYRKIYKWWIRVPYCSYAGYDWLLKKTSEKARRWASVGESDRKAVCTVAPPVFKKFFRVNSETFVQLVRLSTATSSRLRTIPGVFRRFHCRVSNNPV
jgi:hypothetical protein